MLRNSCLKLLSIFVILSTLLSGCDSEDENSGPKALAGIVTSPTGEAVEGASVDLTGAVTYHSSTDVDGRFEFAGVNQGEYVLTVRSESENQQFMEFHTNLAVTATSDEQKIELPDGVILYEPTEVTGSSVKLEWSKSTLENFLEYKLYRHSTSGLDETTGVLVHVATNSSETSFTDTGLDSHETYFYRVFVRNTFGAYGGSNIQETQTAATNHVSNGDLENGMSDWELYSPDPCVTLAQDPTSPFGSQVFLFEISNKNTANLSSEVLQTINHVKLIEGESYRLSFSARVDALPGSSVFYAFLMENSNFHHAVSIKLDNTAANEWTVYSKDFIAPGTTAPYSLFLYLEPVIPYNNEVIRVYVDGVSIVRN